MKQPTWNINWKDLASVAIIIFLIIISIVQKYNLGVLIGCLIIFVFFSYDKIRKIILEMKVRKIYGIEFGEIDEAVIKKQVRDEAKSKGLNISTEEIDAVTTSALNRITGVSYKSQYYEEIVYYALEDVFGDFEKVSGQAQLHADFFINSGSDKILGIEAKYSDSYVLPKDYIQHLLYSMEKLKNIEPNLDRLLLITNSQLKQDDRETLKSYSIPIDTLESVVTLDAIISGLNRYLKEKQQH